MLDEGSTITLININIAREIGAHGRRVILSLTGITSRESLNMESEKVSLSIFGDSQKYNLKGVHAVSELPLPTQTITRKLLTETPHLRELPLRSFVNAVPTILIGQDNIHLIVSREIRNTNKSLPYASKTLLGWVVHGTVGQQNCLEFGNSLCVIHHSQESQGQTVDDFLHQLVKNYFEIDSLGIGSVIKVPSDVRRAYEILESTTRKIGNSWETGLLWRDDHINLPESKSNALTRLFSLEKKLDKDPEYAKMYYREMSRLLDAGYVEKTDNIESADRLWYLPHFGVVNPNKKGKVRIVFDAASKSKGVSLNDRLMSGPDLLQSLLGVLMRFRQGKIAYKSDLRDMFLRVNLRPEDRDAQRFLWRGNDRKGPPEEFRMKTLLFGSKASPCSALFVKNKNAESFTQRNPTAASKIVKQFYMDDLLDSCDQVEDAILIVTNIREINKEAGFEMHGWASNDLRVLEDLPHSERVVTTNQFREFSYSKDEKVLGMRWNTIADTFSFEFGEKLIPAEILRQTRKPTKREFLRIIMSVFDPLGFLAPLVIRAKILMQDIWQSGIKWDENIRDEECKNWNIWLEDLEKTNELTIPRCYALNRDINTDTELHIFCDASMKAYSAVAYWRFNKNAQTTGVAFVAAKTRVAPLKPTSIPRLELQAALIASRLAITIAKQHDFKISRRVFWSDSRTVLSWINTDARTFQTFVSHRLAEISELTSPAEWRWVPSHLNIADDATKYVKFETKERERWIKGPEFLSGDEFNWPVEIIRDVNNEDPSAKKERRKPFVGVVACESNLDLPIPKYERFSSWLRLIRATAKVLIVIERWRRGKMSDINAEHLQRAEDLRVRSMQADSFTNEIHALSSGHELPNKSSILQLSPFIDTNGILRVRGRASRARAPGFLNEPPILDGSHPETRLIIRSYHEKMMHGAHETVINEIQQRFWITKLRSKVRSIVSSCVICKKLRAKPNQPVMGDLPQARVAHSLRPFSHCGVDYFGPLLVKIGRRREKRWGALFTCLTTRAIHLELAHSLSTDSAIMAVRRMAARRGQPLELYSDNGTNFKGANKELRETVGQLDQDAMLRYATNKNMFWNFNPPNSPHMGGAWERLIRSVKCALTAILKEQAPGEEVLLTLLTEVEHIVNSRPLTHVSPDPRDRQALTPNHFLIGTSSGQLGLTRYDIKNNCLRKQWCLAQWFANAFWKRWLHEYLPTLLPRSKWLREVENLRVNDMVLVVDELSPRNTWRIGIVTEVYPGIDNRVRVVRVKTATGDLKRSAAKLIWFAREERSLTP